MTEVLNTNDNEEDLVHPDNSYFGAEKNFPDLKQEIKLPKLPTTVSSYINFSNHLFKPDDLNNNINTMATVICNYFGENVGYVNIN